MRASSAHNRKPDRERLVFAVCQKCGKVTAVYVAKGQDIADILHDNKMCPMGGIYRRDVISVACMSCLEIPDIRVTPEMIYPRVIEAIVIRDIQNMLPQWGEQKGKS